MATVWLRVESDESEQIEKVSGTAAVVTAGLGRGLADMTDINLVVQL